MGSLAAKMESALDIAAFYFPRPNRSVELAEWFRHRGSTAMDLRMPWWNYKAIQAVEARLPPRPRVFEYGGGGSTLWFHDHGARITTVEHDAEWFALLRKALPADCALIYVPSASAGIAGSDSPPGRFYDGYVGVIDEFDDATFDLVVVDGRARVDCVRVSASKVKPGGSLLLDDSDRARYASADTYLTGWGRADYRGVKPGGGGTVQSTIWTRVTSSR